MGEAGIVVLIVVGIALFAGLAYLSWLQAKKRREAFAEFARKIGWRFDPDHFSIDGSPLDHFDMFRKGHSRRAFNTLSGNLTIDELDCAAQAGDYRYKVTTGSGKNRRTRTHRFSYLAFRLPFAEVPDVVIRREGLFDKIGGVFGFDDIDFESEEFSRKFYVQSKDRRFTYDLIHPRMMEFLLAKQPPQIDIEAGYVLLTNGTSTWQIEEFGRRFDFAREFMRLWPPHLVDSLRS